MVKTDGFDVNKYTRACYDKCESTIKWSFSGFIIFSRLFIEQLARNKTLQMYARVYFTTTVQIVARITEMVGVLKTIAFESVVN